MDYLNFLEHQKEDKRGLNLFEKVLIASARAKDLLEERRPKVRSLEEHKSTSAAIYELNNSLIEPIIQKKDENDLYFGEEG